MDLMDPTIVSAINEVARALQKALATKNISYLHRANSLISRLISHDQPLEVCRGDELIIPAGSSFIPSGISWFDSLLNNGLRKQELFLLAGVPYSGKTHIMTYLSSGFAKQGNIILHFNGEDLLGDIYKLYELSLDTEDQLKNIYITDVTDYSFDIHTIEKSVEMMQEKYNQKPDIIIIDHLDIMNVDKQMQDWLGITELTRQLRFLAKKENCIVMTCTQLNYSTSENQSALSRLFRGKVGKVMNADVVLSLEVDPVQHNKIYLQIEKARGRKIIRSMITLTVDFDTMTIGLG